MEEKDIIIQASGVYSKPTIELKDCEVYLVKENYGDRDLNILVTGLAEDHFITESGLVLISQVDERDEFLVDHVLLKKLILKVK